MTDTAPVPTPGPRTATASSARVAAALAALGALDAVPAAEHPAVLESVHEALRTILLESDT